MDVQQEYEAQLDELLSKWQRIHENGDASFREVPDGFILNRIREEILETARKLADKDGGCQERYQKQIPEMVEACYMARADEIRRHAAALLENVRRSAVYQRLVRLKAQAGKAYGTFGTGEATGLVDRLADAVERDDLCLMRCIAESDKIIYEQINDELEMLVIREKKKKERHKRLLRKGQITGQYSIYDISA